MNTLRLRWYRLDDARRDHAEQLARGGLFVRAAPPAGVLYGAKVPVVLITPDGQEHRYEGEVLAAMPGEGMAVTVPPSVANAVLAGLAGVYSDDRDPVHDWWDGRPAAVSPGAAAPKPWEELSTNEKMRLALHGDRDDRAAVLRDKNRSLHVSVLKNPHLTVEEVVAIAKNPQTGAELLEFIAGRSDWVGRAAVAEGVARNPKTPKDVAVRAVQFVATEPLRQMAKGVGAPPHVTAAARKRLLG